MLYGATNSPLRPLINEVKAVANMGFDYLEICLDPPQASPEKIYSQQSQLKTVLDGEGVQLLVAHLPTFVWLADIYDSIREASIMEVEKAMDLCQSFGIKKAVLHPGYLTGLMVFTPDQGKAVANQALERLISGARDRGLTLCLENMFPRAGHMFRPEEFGTTLAQYPDLMMTLDLGHGHIQAPSDRTAKLVEIGGKRIRHVHVSDNSGKEDEHLPLGVGRVNLLNGLAALKRGGYDETMTIEVFSPDADYLAWSLGKLKALWARIP